MEQKAHISLKKLNTFQVEAVAERYVRFDAPGEIGNFLERRPLGDRRHLVLGEGSNLLFAGDFAGVVLHPVFKGIDVDRKVGDQVHLRAMAGENWDHLVAFAVANGWGGLENLSRIPGSVGASAVQNVGAYGVEVKDIIERVEAVSLADGRAALFSADDCGFAYRHSHFKGPWRGRYLVTAVVFRLSRRPRLVLDYPGVRQMVERLGTPSPETVRQAVTAIREAKLPDPARVGNAGSFFKNPVIGEAPLQAVCARFPDLPVYPQAGGGYKLPAGWLIERCGWKGRSLGRAAVHDRQALVLVNLGGATGREILELADRVRESVHETFGIQLEREVEVAGL